MTFKDKRVVTTRAGRGLGQSPSPTKFVGLGVQIFLSGKTLERARAAQRAELTPG
ncbi:MAG: hypothetical protein QOJ15_11294 [Bradyrhizobium sp.]|nr:hypothetical protein [Bradyrhizobium sp.]